MITRPQFLKLLAAAGLTLSTSPVWALETPPQIIKRKIPSSGEELPIVGFGTSRVFDVGVDDRPRLAEVLKILFEAGGTMIDTSSAYFRAEEVVGDLLSELGSRDKAFLATKVLAMGQKAGRRQISNSFRKLHTAKADLFYVHNLQDWKTHLPHLRDLKDQGRIRYIGASHYTDEGRTALAELIKSEEIDFIQFTYSLEHRGAEDDILSLARDRGVAVVINRPFNRGVLFRKVRGKTLPNWAGEFDCRSWAQFFLKYILSHGAVNCVIPGTGRVEHATDNVQAGMGRLPDEKMRIRMQKFWQEI